MSSCDKIYIGQTSRNLKSRITSHKSDIRLEKNFRALAEHSINTNHQPDYEEIQVLDTINSTNKRCFVEMVRIAQEENPMNKRSDIDSLSLIYSYLIKKEIELKTRPVSNLPIADLS